MGEWNIRALHQEKIGPVYKLRGTAALPVEIEAVWVAPMHGTSVIDPPMGRIFETPSVPFARRLFSFRPSAGWALQERHLEFWRALDMRALLGWPPESDSPSTVASYAPTE